MTSVNSDHGGRRRATLTQLSSRTGASLKFKGLSVDVKEKRVLHGVNGWVDRGEVLAVMGPSGSGKTTMFNALVGRLPLAEGEISLDNQRLNKRLRRQMCYVLQNDLLFPYLTLLETFRYAALLRLPQSMSYERKMTAVEEVIDILGVRACQHTIIGNQLKRGLSGGEKKRVSIGQELLANPRLLVMDEPTSGLDSHIAHSLMCTIQDLARVNGRTIVLSIHQPSSQVFHLFNKILLLAKGRVVYFGPGKDAVDFFSRLGFECPINYNPADYLLDVISNEDSVKTIQESPPCLALEAPTSAVDDAAGSAPPARNVLCKQATDTSIMFVDNTVDSVVSASPAGQKPLGDVEEGAEQVAVQRDTPSPRRAEDSEDEEEEVWASSFRQQFTVLFQRAFKNSYGDILSVINIVQVLILVVVSSLIWFQTPRNEAHIRDITGYLFFVAVFFGFQPIILAAGSFLVERSIINRERSSGYYRLSSYFLAKTFSDMPLIVCLPTFFMAITYPISGLGNFKQFILILVYVLLGVWNAQSFGQFVGAVSPTFQKAVVAGATLMITFLLGGGFYVSRFSPNLEWIRYVSYISYMYNALVLVLFDEPSVFYTCEVGNLGTPYPQCRLDPVNSTISGTEIARELRALPVYGLGWVAAVLVAVSLVLRVMTYAVLRWFRKPNVH